MAEIQYEKQLRIKSGALKRNHKEYLSYVKETEEKQTKVDMLKAEEPQDEYKIKKQNELLDDCKQMVPHSLERLQGSYDDLKNWLDAHSQEETIQDKLPEVQELVALVGGLLDDLNKEN